MEQIERVRGCMLGGAAGDALGAPVEFDSLATIRARFGPGGIRDYAPAYGRRGAITDDTQMAMFTAEGLIRAAVRQDEKGICDPPSVVHHAYLRWLATQGERPASGDVAMDGWLVKERALWSRRAPGRTCLAALRHSSRGQPRADNDSKGCGGVMRIAPVGLVGRGDPFTLGCEIAALTHGHPTGQLAAGFLAVVIRGLVSGEPLDAALDAATARLTTAPRHEETLAAVEAARAAAAKGAPGAERVEALGKGWVAEEALAIALYCALVAESFEDGVVLAVNHGGDSDSTGAICGNILGALLGAGAIPERWLADLELRDAITRLANDLHATATDRLDTNSEDIWKLYPGG